MNGKTEDGNDTSLSKCESKDICMVSRWEFGNKYSSMYDCKYLHIDYTGTYMKFKKELTKEMVKVFNTLPEFNGVDLKVLSINCNDHKNYYKEETICLEVLPDFIGNFVNLRELNLSNNKLRTLPSTIGNLNNLRILDVSRNCLTALPDSIGNLKKLEELNLYHNYSLTKFPDCIGNLERLEIINFDKTEIDSLPDSFGNLINLEKIIINDNISYNDFVNKTFKLLSCPSQESDDWSKSVYLNLSNKKLNHIPFGVHKITAIKVLDVSNNQLVKISPLLAELGKLEKLYVHNNPYLDHLPDFLWKMRSLKELKIDGNLIKDLPEKAKHTFDKKNLKNNIIHLILAGKYNIKMDDQKLKKYIGPYIVYLDN